MLQLTTNGKPSSQAPKPHRYRSIAPGRLEQGAANRPYKNKWQSGFGPRVLVCQPEKKKRREE